MPMTSNSKQWPVIILPPSKQNCVIYTCHTHFIVCAHCIKTLSEWCCELIISTSYRPCPFQCSIANIFYQLTRSVKSFHSVRNRFRDIPRQLQNCLTLQIFLNSNHPVTGHSIYNISTSLRTHHGWVPVQRPVPAAAAWPVQTPPSCPCPTWPDRRRPCQGLLEEYTRVVLHSTHAFHTSYTRLF